MLLPTWLRSMDGSSDNRRGKTPRSRRWPRAQRHAAARLSFEALEPRAMLSTFQGLGHLAGGLSSGARDISDDGLVVVGSSNGQAFRWTSSGGMVGLGILPGGGGSTAYGVSADGSVIVGGSDSGQSLGNNDEAFRWTQATGMVALGDLPGGSFVSTARGVSADGSVVVGDSSDGSLQEHTGFRWTAAGGMTALPVLPGTDNDSVMFGVSADGQTIVGRNRSSDPSGPNYAVKWTAATGTVALGRLAGDSNSRANAVSDDGSVIVGTSYAATGQGVRWTDSVIEALGRVPGTAGSWTTDASGDGSTVVGWNYFADQSSAGGFISDAAHGIRDLRTVLETDYGLGSALAGWNLNGFIAATGISANGRVIVGNGINPAGEYEAWIVELTPPDPGAPTVDAGPYQTILVTATAALDGTVSDDGLPAPLTTTWSKQSGPGTVAFGDAAAVDTTATFSTSGTYVLKLEATDTQFTTSDYVYVVVNPVTENFAAVADTYISNASKNASKNFGTAASLIADGNPDIASLLKWNLTSIPVGSTVQSVSLSVNATGASGDSYEIYELKRAWTESQATWVKATTSPSSNWQTAGAQGANDRGAVVLGTVSAPTAGLRTIVLNAAGIAVVQAWVNGAANNGFVLQDYANTTGDDLVFSSREASTAANRPQLIINYVPPAAALSVVAAAGAGSAESSLSIAANTFEGASASDPAPTQLGVLLSVAAEPRKSPGSSIASIAPADGPRSTAADRALANWRGTTSRHHADGADLLDDDLLEDLLATRRVQVRAMR